MPSIPLPDNPDLEHLRAQAKLLKQLLSEGDGGALDMVAEFHPRFTDQRPDAAEAASLKLTDAQLMVARLYGFASWTKLREHLDALAESTTSPGRPAAGTGTSTGTGDGTADEDALTFLQLAWHDYENNPRQREAEAEAFLLGHPTVGRASVFTMAATADTPGLTSAIAPDPDLATTPGGPNRWPPLLHLCYSRISGGTPREAMRLLLGAGADPNAGFLWRGNLPPFTALTGVIGGGERDESPHADALALARILLEAGADPNDGQALYNKARHDHDDTGYLELLLEFGLGTDRAGPWYEQYSGRLHSPERLLVDELESAAAGKPNRMRVLLEHGVDPDQPCGRSRKTPVRIAADGLHFEVLDLLADAGLDVSLTPVEELCRTVLGASAADVSSLAGSPELTQARDEKPALIAVAGARGRLDLIAPLVELGFDINARFGGGGITALHEAASTNNVILARALVDNGADPTIADAHIGAPPIGWARYEGHADVAAYLESITLPE